MNKVKDNQKFGYEITQKGKHPIKENKKKALSKNVNSVTHYPQTKTLNYNLIIFILLLTASFMVGKKFGTKAPVEKIVKVEIPNDFYYKIDSRIQDRVGDQLARKIASVKEKSKDAALYQEALRDVEKRSISRVQAQKYPRVYMHDVKDNLGYYDNLNNNAKDALRYKDIDFDKYISELNGVHRTFSHYLAEKDRIRRLFDEDQRYNLEVFKATHDFFKSDRKKYNNFLHRQSVTRAEFREVLDKHQEKFLDYHRTRRKMDRLVRK